MKSLGVVRKMDDLGRIVIPIEVRRTQGWEPKQPLEMFTDGDALIIKPFGKDAEKQELLSKLYGLSDLTEEAETVLDEVIEFIKKG